jgi:hypothetical protein
MSEEWKKMDLGNGGLQSVNLELTRKQKSRAKAAVLWAFFPLGLHRLYLNSSTGMIGYWILTALATTLTSASPSVSMLAWAGLVIYALYDLYWIDRRVTHINKQLRLQAFLQSDQKPPADYRGRYVDDDAQLDSYIQDKEKEKAGHQPVDSKRRSHGSSQRILSFTEQEKLLKEMQKQKDKRADK